MNKQQKNQIYAIRRTLLRKLINEHYNGNQTKLAEGLSLPSSNITRLLTDSEHRRNVADKMAGRIEQHFGLPAGWLSNPQNLDPDHLKMLAAQTEHQRRQPESRPMPASIPLFALAAAPTYLEQPAAIRISDWVSSTVPRSSKMFAVEMADQSMYNPQAPLSFDKGDILLIEPSIKPASGDVVLLILGAENKTATITELTLGLDGIYHIRYANSHNNESTVLPKQAVIAGVVVERQSRIYNSSTLQQRLYSV